MNETVGQNTLRTGFQKRLRDGNPARVRPATRVQPPPLSRELSGTATTSSHNRASAPARNRTLPANSFKRLDLASHRAGQSACINAAIFTIVDSVLLRTLPVANTQQLVVLTDPDAHGMSNGSESDDRSLLAYSEFEYLRDHNDVFSGIFAADSSTAELQVTIPNAFAAANPAEPANSTASASIKDSARIRLVSGDYFETLAVQPIIGHTFGPEVDRMRNAFPVAVISHAFWSRRFNLDPQVLGRTIEINKTSFEIVGVTPAGFFGESVGDSPDIWVPLTMQAAVYPGVDLLSPFPDGNIDQHMWLQVIARLKPGVTMAQANAAINVALQHYIASSFAGQP